MSWRRGWPLAVTVAALALLTWQQAQLTDGWMYATTGRWIVDNLEVPYRDSFTWTYVGRPWQSNGWLWGVITYAAASAGGVALFAAIKPLATVLIALAIRWNARVFGAEPSAAAVGTVAGTVLMIPWIAERPQLASYVLLPLCMAATTLALADGRLRWRWVLALGGLVAIWSNLHSAVLGVLPLVAAVVVGVVLQERPWRNGRLPVRLGHAALVGVVTLLATLLTPYGTAMWAYSNEVREVSQALTSEWYHPWEIGDPTGWLSLVAMAVVAVVAVRWRLDRRLDLALPLAVSALLALDAVRNVATFTLVAAVVLPAAAPPGLVAGLRRRADLGRVGAVAVAVVALVLAVPAALSTGDPAPDVPVEPTAALPAGCRLANDNRVGNWVLWTRPDIPNSIDGRNDLYRYDLEALIWFRNQGDQSETLADFERLGVDCVLTRNDAGIIPALLEEGWTVVGEDETTVALVAPSRSRP
jgi:hypothetical protein